LDESFSAPQFSLGWWDGAAVVAYLAITFGVALWSSRHQHSSDDFFVGGRRMPWIAVGLSILATLFSTLTYTGAPGEAVKNGVGLLMGYLAMPINVLVVSLLWIPFYMRLKLTSAYEYLERRFDASLRKLGATLFILLRIGWMSMVVFVASMVADQVKGGDLQWLPGRDLLWIIALIGVTAAVYTALGGIEAIIWVDVLQCALLLAGVLLTLGYVVIVDRTGPWDWWATAQAHTTTHTRPPLFSWDVTLRVTVVWVMIGNFAWHICTHGSDQVVLQRYFSTSDLRAARRSYFTNVVVDITMAVLLLSTGFALLSYYLNHPQQLPTSQSPTAMGDKLFPYFLGHQLPAGCAGLILAALLCDAIQTLESGVNSIVAVLTRDLFPRRDHTNVAAGLWRVRMFSLALPLVVTTAAYVIDFIQNTQKLTIVDMMPRFFNMFVGPLAAMFFIGMFLPRCTSRSVWPAVSLGLVVSFVWSWWDVVYWMPYEHFFGAVSAEAKWRPTVFLSIGVPCAVTLLSAFLLSFIRDTRRTAGDVAYSWRGVMQSPP
jgi:SSS family solute:Na+ symporter